jgi:hypothetical protein
MIRAIIKKDWALLWPLAILVILIQLVLEWALYKAESPGAGPVAYELLRLLTPAWYIGLIAIAVAVVQEDTIPGVDQDWLVRPLQRRDLLLAKMLFILGTVCLPMLVLNVTHSLAAGFAVMPSIADAFYKEVYLFICLLVPAMAVASATRNMSDLVVLVVGLVVLYAASLWVAAMLFGADRCPTCDTSVSWLQHLLQHLGLLIGSAVVLALQYYRRRTRASRMILAAGVVLLVLVQLPWDTAFAIQTQLGAPIGSSPAVIRIAADPAEVTEQNGGGRNRQDSARRATQALLKGDVDSAVQSLRGMRHPAPAPLTLSVPLRITGLNNDDLLVVDHAEFALLDAQGKVLYSANSGRRESSPLLPELAEPDVIRQKFEIPGLVYQQVGSKVASVVIDFSLTVRAVVAQHRLPALGGEIRSSEVGLCQSNADPSATYIRCKQIGQAPNCYAATLYGPDGRHNPPVQLCASDYRPFIPAPASIINVNGMDLPIRDSYGVAHYEVDGSDLSGSYVILKVYATGAHFHRKVMARVQARSLSD